MTVLIGGARSGKSHIGQRLVEATGLPVSMVVTAEAGDDEMAVRIDKHRNSRPAAWTVIEAPRRLVEAVDQVPSDHALLLDCVTFWVANLVMDDVLDVDIEREATDLGRTLARRGHPVVVVSNEVGQGIVPADAMSRRFRDVHGRVNKILADGADQSFLVVAGQVLPLTRL